ncbi:hypothetical protein CAPTEDRAFT_181484 [Capitella teleta]|uniref:Amino acid transporter transmembrane domain-containing protein n=1 Tax=Capitella teleta TaxID=283909 RepID=R7U1W4_CAPTE|nr:hypothetical protein CAPTEDRAFT_181484 [Capitella teleta]|eukprot:ELT99979.1 hypothetical protein CAPTEDRAFT_181484 [Capitella teleta]
MADSLTDSGSLYSPLVGLVFVFNLIVGTGALTMPRAFETAGWLISLVLIIVLAIMSYITATFVIESMASANAVSVLMSEELNKEEEKGNQTNDINDKVDDPINSSSHYESEVNDDERSPLLAASDMKKTSIFEIRKRIEMGFMASMFFHKVGLNLFYLAITIYLYGDLAIYMAAVPKSLRNVACTYMGNFSDNMTHCSNYSLTNSDPCWAEGGLTRIDTYRIFVAMFTLILGPFVFFNAQKTKYLQLFTTLMRWLAFSMMIILALIRIGKRKAEGHPQVANFQGIPTLFGVCIYSFMCHHSLPSLVTPIKNKSQIYALFGWDYLLILIFYLLLSFTGIFSFSSLQDLYTLNFQYNSCDGESAITKVVFVQYFLALYPVFTLSTNIPIIGITLRNNLKALFQKWAPFSWTVDRIVFPVITISIPVVIACVTDSVEILVGITGSYAGAAIQYFVPACLVLCSRKYLKIQGSAEKNPHRSPFSHSAWVYAVLVWGVLCIAFVSANYAIHGLRV